MNVQGHDRKKHWERVYSNTSVTETSWHQDEPRLSLSMIANTGAGPGASLIDIGGGASVLVNELLDLGYQDLTVLDVSSAALQHAAQRLGGRSSQVTWIEADATAFRPPRQFDIWHDRAAFHFLTAGQDRLGYMEALRQALAPGGQVIMATFAPGGPEKCSGLNIIQYDSGKLQKELGPDFILQEQQDEIHRTPANRQQLFRFFRFKRQ